MDLDLICRLDKVQPHQLEKLLPLVIGMNYINYDSDAQSWINYDISKIQGAFTKAYIEMQRGKGVQEQIRAQLNFMEDTILRKIAAEKGLRWFPKVAGEDGEKENSAM
ncbi:Hypothetical_protein [Hexamita inflata]|nr:Hypothetical protein HINF_LOCUS30466 [Hexamita inflata]